MAEEQGMKPELKQLLAASTPTPKMASQPITFQGDVTTILKEFEREGLERSAARFYNLALDHTCAVNSTILLSQYVKDLVAQLDRAHAQAEVEQKHANLLRLTVQGLESQLELELKGRLDSRKRGKR